MEFGSDFHRIKEYPRGKFPLLAQNEYQLYTSGRQALEAILIKEEIKRIWVPAYYCHESLARIRRMDVEIEFYPATPIGNPYLTIAQLQFEHGDALLCMNYFGLQLKPCIPHENFILIEDHSHSLSGSWVKNSDADWCFASLRKTLPIADGGILWSPRKRVLPEKPCLSQMAIENAVYRYVAMDMKSNYLNGENILKETFLNEFHRTEHNFENLGISAISNVSKEIVESINIEEWDRKKKDNWNTLSRNLIPRQCKILFPEKYSDIPFSLILLFDSSTYRDRVLKKLIEHNVFPAILWRIPTGNNEKAIDFGNRMLSIHCDARYTKQQMYELTDIINKILGDD